jgi:hypothetical protein
MPTATKLITVSIMFRLNKGQETRVLARYGTGTAMVALRAYCEHKKQRKKS